MAGLGQDGLRIQVGLEDAGRRHVHAGDRSQQFPKKASLATTRLRPPAPGVPGQGQQRGDIPGCGGYGVEHGAIPGKVRFGRNQPDGSGKAALPSHSPGDAFIEFLHCVMSVPDLSSAGE
ncbi:MAG: hypothetical protein NVSMB43_08640 [Pseudarthrobacter sp.]